jgi:AraC-like DNA-binding protein
MLAQFEKVRPALGSFTAFARIEAEFPFCWHYHPEFELTLITDGKGQRMVGDGICEYGPGDLALLGPNLPHSYRSWPAESKSSKLQQAIVIQFREDCFGDQFFRLQEMRSILQMFQRSASGLAFGGTRAGEKMGSPLRRILSLSPARRIVTFLSILVELAAENGARTISTERVQPLCRVEEQKRIDQICSYLNRQYEDEIDFKNLAEAVHMSQESLCRFFRRATGRTMTTYINQLRVGAAAQLLTTSDMSVLDVGFKVGFGNYSNFNRQFKRIKGSTPLSFRHEFPATR